MADSPRQAADLRRPAAGGAARSDASGEASPRVARRPPVIPERYSLREKDGERFLECDEAPRLRAIIDPEMGVSRSEAASLGERVILLDGAGSFGPLIDNDQRLYNLDHHAGCERLFTLSTCEQALLLVQSGLELQEGDWTVYANDPDLDTVLALWVLLNHRRVRELRTEARDVLLPLLRLEGAIDANGPELAMLCGLPSDWLEVTKQRIDDLLARERGLKQTGSWSSKNVHGYTLEMLRAIDGMVYRREDFGDHTRIEEIYGHAEIAPGRVAVACRDRSGIYTVEQHLKSRWGDQLSIIALENQPHVFTLRRISSVSGPQLEPAYEMLNRLDPAVDGRPPGKRWGGSRDIGGSPRPRGTRLSAEELLDALARAYRPSSWWKRTRRSLAALAAGVAFLLLPPFGAVFATLSGMLASAPATRRAWEVAGVSLLALAVGMLATRAVSRRRPWVFGWRAAANGGGWWLAPLALIGALPVAAWASAGFQAGAPALPVVALAGLLALAALEVWFRGLVHGMLAVDFEVQRPRGPWLLSRAALVSSAAYAGVVTVLARSALAQSGPAAAPVEVLGAGIAAFAVGLSLAALRERSLSLWPGLTLQAAALVAGVVGVALS